MTEIMQVFVPPIKMCRHHLEDVQIIRQAEWGVGKDKIAYPDLQYIGSRQIEEVWKHYYKGYYVSNYGYIVKIKPEDLKKAEDIIPYKLKKIDEASEGMRWVDFPDELKKLFRDNAFVPKNRKNSGCQVCLNLTGKTAEYDVHRIVARFFLDKPADYNTEKYVVHHIDNNSYNNSVVNLIYVKGTTHIGDQHKYFHPLSYK